MIEFLRNYTRRLLLGFCAICGCLTCSFRAPEFSYFYLELEVQYRYFYTTVFVSARGLQ